MIQPAHRTHLFMAAAAIICLVGIMWGLPHHWDFAQDSVVPLGRLAQINAAGDAVTQYRYPPFHLLVLKVVFVPVRMAVNLGDFGRKTSDTLFVLSARLVSAAMALGILRLLMLLGKRLWDQRVGLLAAAIFVLSPVTLYYAKNANLDIPYVFWLAWTLLVYVRILQEDRARDYLWLGLLAALAVCTKDQAYAFLLLMPIALVVNLRRKYKPNAPSGMAWKKLAVGFCAFIVPFALIHNILFAPQDFWLHLKTITGPGSEGWREFSRGPTGQARLLIETILRLMDAWTPTGVVLAGVGLWLGLRPGDKRAVRGALLVPMISYYLFFPCVVGYVYTRFMLPLLLVLSLFAAAAVLRLWEKKRAGRITAVVLVGWIALAGLSVDVVMRHYSRYEAQMWLERQFPGQTLHYPSEGDEPNLPRINEPMDAKPLVYTDDRVPLETALQQKRPAVLLLSLDTDHPYGARCLRISSILRRSLRKCAVGRVSEPTPETDAQRTFSDKLLSGKLSYRVAARFVSPVAPAWFIPEVSESLNRTIIVMVREPTQ